MMRDYRCKKCGEVVEVYFPRLTNAVVSVCAKRGVKMEKKPSAPNFKVDGGTPKFYKGESK